MATEDPEVELREEVSADFETVRLTEHELSALRGLAQNEGLTFEEYFTKIVRLALKNITENPVDQLADFGLSEFQGLRSS